MVVGDRNETAFLRDALQLLRRNLVPDPDLFEDMGREFRADGFVEFMVDAVYFFEFQQLVGCRSDAATQPALDSQELLQFVDFQNGRLGLRFGFGIAFFHLHLNYQR